tara:strand:+ start:3079 stop:3690 length:612 start_codon:yes stop_codon:yes gene_type:complete
MAISNPVYEDDDSVDEQIRAAAEERSANKAAPTIEADEEAPAPAAAKMPMRPGQAFSGKKTPIVTLEQLGGMTLGEYLNKQQGLKPREKSSAPARMPVRPGQETPTYSNEGRNKPGGSLPASPKSSFGKQVVTDKKGRTYALQSPYDKMLEENANKSSKSIDFGFGMKKGGTVKKMASGGSVSSASKRADGIAQRGKTKGKMC